MPVRDGARWLRQAIESVLAQSLHDFELIVVDDGSIDDSPAILAGYQGREGRLRIVRTGRAGLVAALNRGIAEAAAPLIARLDADDIALPHRLARQVTLMQDNPRLELAGSWADIIDADGRPAGLMRRPMRHEELAGALDTENPFIHSSVVFRTDTVRSLGGYRAALAAAEDYDLWCRLAEAGEVQNLAESLIRYRDHTGGVTRTNAVRQAFSVRMARRARAARKATGRDPADALDAPPDIFDAAGEQVFYAADAEVCRFLALSAREDVTAERIARIDFDAFRASLPGLSRGERRLAQQAAFNLIAARGLDLPVSRAALTHLMIRLYPARAPGFAVRLLQRQPAAPGPG